MAEVPKHGRFHAIEEMDDESLIYRRASKTAIYLNETATVVWKLCDGTRSVDDIVAILSESYPESAASLRADVEATVASLIETGALVLGEAETRTAEVVVERD